ncbi:MAG: undecaprenyl/decaprenyl-phosphate alpha-N-acetylglucosaminyl 1-phosphate transferase [Patescibacteria group bacterium]|nr:undecaprenyl/decaprenyl-phosphate alpha-N-acetylglucosaminyl 1-phosphate transferase [Patescibacteria group bacterium]
MVLFLEIFFIAFFLSFFLTLPTIFLAKKLNLVTDRKKRKHPAHTHQGIIPRAGGLPIYISVLITTLIFIPLNKIVLGILIASFFLLLLGLFDDYYDLSPYLRFFLNFLICGIAIGFGLGIPYISHPFGGIINLSQPQITINIFGLKKIWLLADLLALIWLVWIVNMVNWSKGVDGQLPGFVAIAGLFLGLLSQRFSSHDISIQAVTIFSFIVSGAFLGFLPWNFYPQKIIPGYGGGALAGFFLGVLSILSFGKLGTAILILSVPMIDAFYTILRRLKNKKSPFRADWGHFHHRLLEIGWGRRRIAIFYWLVSFILGISALFLKGKEKLIAFLTIGIVLLIFIVLIEKVKKVNR